MPEHPVVADVESAARDEVVTRLVGAVADGMTVAVGAGSRGLTNRVELLRGTIAGLRDLGAAPFVVPAMGSHGGATSEGQLATLATLGITPDAVDAEIRSSMETSRRRPRRRRPSAAPRRPRRGRRPHPGGQPDEAAHRVPGGDRERVHEDDRRRLRQAAGRRQLPRQWLRPRCPTSCSTASKRCAARGGSSVRWPRWRRRPARSSPCAPSAPTTWAASRDRPRRAGTPTSSRHCRSRRSTSWSSRRAARRSPGRRSTPTSRAVSGSMGWPTCRRRGWR